MKDKHVGLYEIKWCFFEQRNYNEYQKSIKVPYGTGYLAANHVNVRTLNIVSSITAANFRTSYSYHIKVQD